MYWSWLIWQRATITDEEVSPFIQNRTSSLKTKSNGQSSWKNLMQSATRTRGDTAQSSAFKAPQNYTVGDNNSVEFQQR